MRTRTFGLDKDTTAFANRVYAGSDKKITGTPLKQLNKFVVGIKRLGLWNSMVAWPMRSIHNAGTGSTVYSLGGLGVYNGTMVNSPVWGLNGISFASGSSHKITTALSHTTDQVFVLTTCIPNYISAQYALYGAETPTRKFSTWMDGAASIRLYSFGTTFNKSTANTAITNNTPNTIMAGSRQNEEYVGINSTFAQSFASQLLSGSATYGIGYRTFGAGDLFWNGMISFNYFSNVFIQTSSALTIKNLYRQTIGQNLQLP
jgi:hypothetical protein